MDLNLNILEDNLGAEDSDSPQGGDASLEITDEESLANNVEVQNDHRDELSENKDISTEPDSKEETLLNVSKKEVVHEQVKGDVASKSESGKIYPENTSKKTKSSSKEKFCPVPLVV